jgi:hypothetical protein
LLVPIVVSITDGLSQGGDKSNPSWKEAFEKSRWFTGGWTLQELLGPASVQFFSREGKLLGEKESLEPEIRRIFVFLGVFAYVRRRGHAARHQASPSWATR